MSLAERIRCNLTDDLRRPEYRDNPNPMAGHCYVASEAYFHLSGGKNAGLTVCRVKHEGATHWFLEGPEGIVDLTADQFASTPPYSERVRTGFLTKTPSSRARKLMARTKLFRGDLYP